VERLVLDSSVWIAIERRKLDFSDVIGMGMTLILPAMVAAELKHAVKDKARTPMQMQRSLNYLSKVEALTEFAPFDQLAVEKYVELSSFCQSQGKPRSLPDLMIAATAVAQGALLKSFDNKAKFEELPNVRVLF
jgi:tRNA(fMet)-specific endonuclease VapC